MIDKRVASAAEAVADIFDGATIMFSGFGEAGSPIELDPEPIITPGLNSSLQERRIHDEAASDLDARVDSP